MHVLHALIPAPFTPPSHSGFCASSLCLTACIKVMDADLGVSFNLPPQVD